MTQWLTRAKQISKEQIARLKLNLHISNQKFQNSQNKKNTIYLKFGLVLLVILITIGLLILAIASTWTGINQAYLGSNNQTVSQSSSQQAEVKESKSQSKPAQIIYEIKSYIELVEPVINPDKSGSINIRETACGDNIVGSANWATVGQIIEGPISKECFGSNWNWYKVKWPSGAIGWSIDNHFRKIESIRKYSNSGIQMEYPFDWQVNESKNSSNQLVQILFQKGSSKLTVNTVSTSGLIGTLQNNQPACVGGLKDITGQKEFYRVKYGHHEIGEKKEKINYYKYIDKSQFFTRQNPNFDTLYNKYLTKTQDTISSTETSKMPYIDLFDIQVCATSITPSYTTLIIAGSSQSVYIDLQTKDTTELDQIIEEADKIVQSIKKPNP